MIPGGGYSEVCGGQTIADGSRFRTGGGILWNILKSREPKAYKEIMAKGKELEVHFFIIMKGLVMCMMPILRK